MYGTLNGALNASLKVRLRQIKKVISIVAPKDHVIL